MSKFYYFKFLKFNYIVSPFLFPPPNPCHASPFPLKLMASGVFPFIVVTYVFMYIPKWIVFLNYFKFMLLTAAFGSYKDSIFCWLVV